MIAAVVVVEYEVLFDSKKEKGLIKAKRVAASHVIAQTP